MKETLIGFLKVPLIFTVDMSELKDAMPSYWSSETLLPAHQGKLLYMGVNMMLNPFQQFKSKTEIIESTLDLALAQQRRK